MGSVQRYCLHPNCRAAVVRDLAWLAGRLNRNDLWDAALHVKRDEEVQVPCREETEEEA